MNNPPSQHDLTPTVPAEPTPPDSAGMDWSSSAPGIIEHLYRNSPNGLIATSVLSTVLLFTHWPVLDHTILIGWWSISAALTLGRAVLIRSFRRTFYSASPATWFHRQLLGVGLSGMLWGAAGVLLFTQDSIPHQAVLAVILAGLIAGAVPTFSASLVTYLAFAFPATIPTLIRFALVGETPHFAIGSAGFVFLSVMTWQAWINNQHVVRLLTLRSERNRAEQDLITLFDRTHDLIQSVAPDGRILMVNRAWRETLGYTEAETASLNIFDVLHPDTRDHCISFMRRLLAGEEIESIEITFQSKSGRLIVAEGQVHLHKENGHTVSTRGIFRDITRRKAAELTLQAVNTNLEHLVAERTAVLTNTEEALRASQEHLRLSLAASNTGLWEWHVDTNAVSFSREWKRQLGYEEHELANSFETWSSRLHPDDHDNATAYATAYAGDPQGDFLQEFRMRHKDGSYRWIEARASFVTEQDGRRVRLLGSHIDITERKQTEQALQFLSSGINRLTGEAFFGEMASSLAAIMKVEIGFVGKLLPVHPLRIRTVGLHMDGAPQNPVEYDLALTPCERVIGKTTAIFPEHVVTLFPADDMLVDLRVESYAAVPLFDTGGRPIGHVGVMSRRRLDHLRQIENLLRIFAAPAAAELERQRTEEKFHDLFEFSPDAIVLINQDGVVSLVNHQAETLFGYQRKDFVGLSIKQLFSASSGTIHDDVAQRFFSTSSAHAMNSGRDAWHGTKNDGTVFPIDLSLNPIETEEGRMIVATVRDITQRKSAEAALQASQDQVRHMQKIEAVGQLAGGMAHDFNNLLTAILGNADMATRKTSPTHAARPHLARILEAGERASHVVEQILTFTRQQEAVKTVISLEPIVTEALTLLRATLPAGVHLTGYCAPDTPAVFANSTQIHQVLMNLCTNAWHALRDQPGRITVEMASATLHTPLQTVHNTLSPGCYACVSVSDTGCGMSPDMIVRIFDPFFTTKPVGQGTGLGLSVVHGIVQDHEGGILVTSIPGQGTTFHLYFPKTDQLPAQQPQARSHGTPAIPYPGKGRILYVDDEEMLVELMHMNLGLQGYEVTGCTNPQKAIAMLRANPDRFDAVVTDFNMPSQSGMEVAREVSAINPTIPIVLVSGYLSPADHTAALASGIRAVVDKPVMVRTLEEILANLLSRKNPDSERRAEES